MINYKIQEIEKIIFSTELIVRVGDINYGNHLGHDSLISLLHEARVRFLKEHGHTELNIDGLAILVKNLAVNYMQEAFYGNRLVINIGIGEIHRTSIQLIYKVTCLESNKDTARAITTITFYDYQKRRVSKVPQSFLESIKVNNLKM